jgi:hypothetical protein
MAEADIAIFIATAVALGIVTAIQFIERGYRYKRIKEKKPTGTLGFSYESSPETKEETKQ